MTHRLVSTRSPGRAKIVTGTPDGRILPAIVMDEETPLLVIPPLSFDSARSPTSGYQSQNSNTINHAQGYVKEQDIPVSRTVAVYRVDTKQLLVKGESGGNGFFSLAWRGYSGKVSVNIFTKDGTGYNSKIFDLVVTN